MKRDDFRCIRRGKPLFRLKKEDAFLLAPLERRNGKTSRALLLLHGFTSTPAVFRTILPSLSFYDAIFCPLLPGHGDNLETFAGIKAQNWIKAAEQSFLHLANDYQKVDVLGLSLGGLLACHLSSCFNLEHLYLLAPALHLRLSINSILNWANVLNYLGFTAVRNLAGDLHTNEHCEIAYRQLPLRPIIEIASLIKQFTLRLPSCPTDVFLGCHDHVVASEQVATRFANQKHIRIHWLANSAHVLPLDGDVLHIIECIKQQAS